MSLFSDSIEEVRIALDRGDDRYQRVDDLEFHHHHCFNGNIEIVKMLDDMGLLSRKGYNRLLMDCIDIAAASGQLEVIKLLRERGHEISKSALGNTPLHIAASKGHLEVVEYFKEELQFEINDHGFTALHIACHNGNTDVAKLLMCGKTESMKTHKDELIPLHIACLNCPEMILPLYSESSSKTRDSLGRIPLHYISDVNVLERVFDIDMMWEDHNGVDPMLRFVALNNIDVVKFAMVRMPLNKLLSHMELIDECSEQVRLNQSAFEIRNYIKWIRNQKKSAAF